MSDLPIEPASDDGQDQGIISYTPTMALADIPQRIEDLSPPYSAYPHIDLKKTVYPENAADGLGIRHVRPYAHWVFERWHTWSPNDFYAVYVNDLLNALAADITLDERPRYDLFVPEEQVPEGEVPIYGRVLRAGSFQESTSPLQTILIKTTRPGGTDRDPGSPWHTGLTMTVEGLLEGATIDQNIIAAGLWCLIKLYEHIRQNDLIELSWDGVMVKHTVSPAEAAGPGPIRVHVPKETILKGGLLGQLNIRYRVQDVVENFSGEKYQYSKPYFLVSELDPSLLSAPIVLVDGEESSQIDFDTQSGSVFEVVVLTTRQFPTPTPRHQIIVSLFATLVDGSTQVFTLPAVTDNNLGFTTVPISIEIIEQIVGGSFRVSFLWQTASGAFLGQSGSITITVIGTPVSMPGVTITPIELGLIDPDHDIQVAIPFYEPHSPDWLETLVIEYRLPGGGGETYFEDQLAGPQGGIRHVLKEDLQRFKGLGTIFFYYLVNDGSNTRKSAEVGAQVGERVADMPEPILQGTQGNNVDPTHVTGPTVLLTLPYTGTLDGDLLHWNCVGSALGGSASDTIRVNVATAGRPLVFPVSRTILDYNLNGSLRITYSLERNGPPRLIMRSEVLNLTVGQGVQLDRPEVRGAQQFPDRLSPLAALLGAIVVVKFRPMHATDQIYVDWLSADGIGSITLEVQGNPVTNEVSVTVPPEIIAKGIREGGNRIRVQYRFFRGTFPYASEVLDLELLPLTGLPTPTIDGIGDSLILLLSQLTDAARTRIPVWSFISANQLMWMTYEGTFADGTPYREDTYTGNEVTPAGVLNGISPPAPVDKLRRLLDGSLLTIYFWVTLSESADKNSAVLFGVRNHIVQAIPATLPAPAFHNLPGATLSIYPLDYEHYAFVAVAYSGMNSAHRIELQWIYPDCTMATISAQDGLDGGRVDFIINARIIANSVGKTITLRYIATINGAPVDSFVQTLTVQTIRESDLSAPLINEIPNGGTLDLRDFTGNGKASVRKWPLSFANQKVWLTCRSAGVEDLKVLDAYSINSGEAASGLANKDVVRSWFMKVPSSRLITIHCEVTMDGSTDRLSATLFPEASYIVRRGLRVTGTIQAGNPPSQMAITPDGRRLYVSHPTSTYVSVIDTASNTIIRNININNPAGLAVHPDGSKLYISHGINSTDSNITVISTATYAVLRTIKTNNKGMLCLNSSGTRLYASILHAIDTNPGSCLVIDTTSYATIALIAPLPPRTFDISISRDNTRVYVANLYGCSVIDTANNSLIREIGGPTLTISVLFSSSNALNPKLYLASDRPGTVAIFNANTLQIEKTITGLTGAWELASNPINTDIYLSHNSAIGSLSVINTHTDSVVETVGGLNGPAHIAVAPDGATIYVSGYSEIYIIRSN